MAGGISDEDIQKVRDANDIVAVFSDYTQMKQRGRDFWCCCPFHQEKTPSCKVDPSTQLWHCFGCGEGGDIFSFIMKHNGVSFPDAVRTLAERAHVQISDTGSGNRIPNSQKARLMEICKETADFYHLQLMRSKSPEAQQAREYLGSRGLGGKVPNNWTLGFAPGRQSLVTHLRGKGFKLEDMVEANVAMKSKDGRIRDRFFNRIMFPIRDAQGEVIAFGGRVIGKGEPKYLNSQETPLFHKSRVLYGLDKAKGTMASTGIAIIVEGYTDVISLHEKGITNVVATLGTALTMNHIRIISRHAQNKIVYLFDGDAAGQRAADRALQFIDDSMTPEAGRSRIELCAVTLPDNLDPADYVSAHSAEELLSCINGAKPLLEYGIERRLTKYDLSRPEGRTRATTDALSVLAPIKDSLLAKDYAVQIASRVRAREEDVLEQLAKLKPPRRFDEEETAPDNARPNHPSATSNSQGQYPPSMQGEAVRTPISQTEVNRLRIERELLSLCAQNTPLALSCADKLAQTQWHDSVHSKIAESILETLAENPSANPADIIRKAAAVAPVAPKVLTSSTARAGNTDNLANYLFEELTIGDTEDAIAMMKSDLARGGLSSEESEILFQGIVSMQKTVNAMKANHKLSSGNQPN